MNRGIGPGKMLVGKEVAGDVEHSGEARKWVTLVFDGSEVDPYTLLVEPWGMTYELASSEDRIFVDLSLPDSEWPRLVAWPGGVSIICAGPTVTRDAAGVVLDEF